MVTVKIIFLWRYDFQDIVSFAGEDLHEKGEEKEVETVEIEVEIAEIKVEIGEIEVGIVGAVVIAEIGAGKIEIEAEAKTELQKMARERRKVNLRSANQMMTKTAL